jgi:hypothetical protein
MNMFEWIVANNIRKLLYVIQQSNIIDYINANMKIGYGKIIIDSMYEKSRIVGFPRQMS